VDWKEEELAKWGKGHPIFHALITFFAGSQKLIAVVSSSIGQSLSCQSNTFIVEGSLDSF
jgi:hypothetical protein